VNSEQFARMKLLFGQLSDMPADERERALQALNEEPVVLAELRNLLSNTAIHEERFAAPVASAMASLAPAGLSDGDVLGAWTLLEEIGKGGMGKVFRARRSDGHFEQVAAIKLLAGLPSPKALKYLARERQILASLAHPNISRLLDGGSTPDGQPFLVMEYVEGVPIHEYCEQHSLSIAARLRLLIDVCGAVSFAHQQLVVHCDLKPSNILVTGAGRPILLDFGISRQLIEADPDDVAVQASVKSPPLATGKAYTPRYASPEQIATRRVGTATDIYSLGLVLAELVGATLTDHGPPETSRLPRELAAIISKATQHAPEGRYQSAETLAADLKRFLAHQPLQALPRSLPYVSGKWIRRQWPWVVVGLIFLATTLGFSWRMRQERDGALKAEHTARAVTHYMVSVFQGADPEITGQRDLPVSKLLDAGRDRLAAELADQPSVRAEMASILGGVYQTIGQREQALALFDDGLALVRPDRDPQLMADLLHKKAYTKYDQEDFSAAEQAARKALAMREQYAAETPDLVNTLRLLGSILVYQNSRDEAETYLTRALEMAKRVSGPQSVAVARAHVDLARLHLYFDLTGGETTAHARAAMSILERERGKEHYLYVDALEFLALGLNADNDFAEALPLAREVSEKRIKLYGDLSYQAGYGLYSYGGLLDDAGLRLQALPVAMRCLEIQEKLDGEGQLSGTPPRRLLAAVQLNLGLYDQAAANYAALMDIRTRLQPENTRKLLEDRYNLGRAKRLAGDLAGARLATEGVLTALLADPQSPPFYVFRSKLEMAIVLRLEGKLSEASAMLASLDLSAIEDQTWRQGEVEVQRALIAAAEGQVDQASELFLAAEARMVESFGPKHPDTWLFKLDRAEFLARTGQTEAAQHLAQQIAEGAGASIAAEGALAKRLQALGAPIHPESVTQDS
jgi:eukaryotic-like serine/threonine-protein kinase